MNLPTFGYINSHLRYEPETGLLFWKKAGQGRHFDPSKPTGCKNGGGYMEIRLDRKTFQSHRIAWLLSTGKWPQNQIDHINHIKSDNRLTNLREATGSENQHNQKNKTDSDVLGVSFHKRDRKWFAYIGINGKKKHLGYFRSVLGAVRARKEAEEKYFGEFAPLPAFIRNSHENQPYLQDMR